MIPREVRRELGVGENDLFEVTTRDDGVIELRKCGHAAADQRWFWAEKWQRKEREADKDIAACWVNNYESGEAFESHLDEIVSSQRADSLHKPPEE